MSVVEGVLAGTLAAGVLLLLGSPLLYRGWKHRSRYVRFREMSIETPATAPAGETALITGTARATGDGGVTAPVSGDRAVFTAWDIHSLRRFHPLGVRWVWAPEALGVDTSGFEVAGDGHALAVPNWSRNVRIEGRERLQLSGTGQLPVDGMDVDGLWVEAKGFDAEERVLPGEAVPERLRELGSRVGFPGERPDRLLPTLPRVRTPEATLRYRDLVIQDGQDVTVLGTVREASTPGRSRRLVEPDECPALVSPLDPATLIDRYRWSYWKSVYGLGLVLGLVATAVGVGVAL